MKTAQVDIANLTTLSFVFFQTDFLPRVRPAFSGGASRLVSVTEELVEDCWGKKENGEMEKGRLGKGRGRKRGRKERSGKRGGSGEWIWREEGEVK